MEFGGCISRYGEWGEDRRHVCIYDTIWCFESVSKREKSVLLARDMDVH